MATGGPSRKSRRRKAETWRESRSARGDFGKLSRVIHDAQGFWLSQEAQVEPDKILEGEVNADVVVLGGGFSGMWTAWLIREAEPNARVVLLEAGLCGHGPSGRNGGFANSMWFGLGSMRDSF